MTTRLSIRTALRVGTGMASLCLVGMARAESPTLHGTAAGVVANERSRSGAADKRADNFGVDVAAATWVPLSMGPELGAELPGRFLVQAHLGWMPELYSRTLTEALEDAGVYDARIGALIDGAFQSATTWRLSVGMRPFEDLGFEVFAGYARVALSGATTTSEITPLLPPGLADQVSTDVGEIGISLDSSLHHFTLAAGWRWLIAERWLIRANLGYLQAFDSSSQLTITGYPELSRLADARIESVLHDHYMRYVKAPVLGIAIGYRFF